MAYRVELTRRAEREIDALYDRLSAEDSAAGANWFNGLEDAIFSLERLPHRCPIAAESKTFGRTLRHLIYGAKHSVYRVIYEIDDAHQLVWVRTVRHAAMDEFNPRGRLPSPLPLVLPALFKRGYQFTSGTTERPK